MANQARKESLQVENTRVDISAKEKYSSEVTSLYAKLRTAQLNAPKERKAQLEAAAKISKIKEKHKEINEYDKDSMDKLSKYAQDSLSKARSKYGANKKSVYISITDKEWEAIKAGAVNSSTISAIINNTDNDILRKRATSANNKELTDARKSYIRQLESRGYSLSEIADKIGVSPSTVADVIKN